jgi:hypothetical protein
MFDYNQLSELSTKIKTYSVIKRTLEQAFKGLVLNEKYHSYTFDGRPLNSTSKYIAQFDETPFNAHNISYGVTRGQNTNVFKHKTALRELTKDFLLKKETILVRYKLMADEAIAMGNRIHMYSEMYPFFIKPHCDQEDAVLDWFKRYLGPNSKYVYVTSELRIFDTEFMKAGTVDLILYNTKTEKLVIVDWKSNHKSLLMSYKNQMLSEPFQDLIAAPYNKYSLQLSDYKNIIEKNTEFEVEDMFIIHLFPEALNYMSKYKNKAAYVQIKKDGFIVKSKTRKYTMFRALDLTEKLKKTYDLSINKDIF